MKRKPTTPPAETDGAAPETGALVAHWVWDRDPFALLLARAEGKSVEAETLDRKRELSLVHELVAGGPLPGVLSDDPGPRPIRRDESVPFATDGSPRSKGATRRVDRFRATEAILRALRAQDLEMLYELQATITEVAKRRDGDEEDFAFDETGKSEEEVVALRAATAVLTAPDAVEARKRDREASTTIRGLHRQMTRVAASVLRHHATQPQPSLVALLTMYLGAALRSHFGVAEPASRDDWGELPPRERCAPWLDPMRDALQRLMGKLARPPAEDDAQDVAATAWNAIRANFGVPAMRFEDRH